jgi:PadR family transcriptional regulator, regulatory protein PadR
MKDEVKLTHTSALVLKVISGGCNYGFDIMERTGLQSGTVYPILRRLEESGLILAQWEPEAAQQLQRPQRRYYKLSRVGERTLAKAAQRYPLLQNLTAGEEKR